MKNIVTIAGIAASGALGYLIGGKNGEAKGRREASTKKARKAIQKAQDAKSKRQQRPALAVAATLTAAQRATAKSRKRTQKLQKARGNR